MTSIVTAPRVYASSVGGRVRPFLWGLFGVPAVAVGFPLVVLDGLVGVKNSKILIAVCVGILIVGGILVLLHVFVTGQVRIETDATTVRLRKGFRTTGEWQRATTGFSSLVVRQSTNGVPTSTTRKLIVQTASERTEVQCVWFTAATFTDLLADLSPVASDRERALDETAPLAERHRTFVLNRAATAVTGVRKIAVVVILAALLGVLAYSAVPIMTDSSSDGLLPIFFGGLVIVLALVVFIVFLAGRKAARRIPGQITLAPSTIQIDGTVFYFGQLRSISLTPPDYTGRPRVLMLVENVGTTTRYTLGTAAVRGRAIFPDYGAFVELLGRSAPKGLVRLDLS